MTAGRDNAGNVFDFGGGMYSNDPSQRIVDRDRGRADSTAHPSALARRILGLPIKFSPDAKIYGEGEPANFIYEVVDGAVRTVKALPGGRRQIGEFYFPGHIFGLDEGDGHSFSAEAVVQSTVRVIDRWKLIRMAEHDGELARQLLLMIGDQLAQAQRHALMLIETAQERVSSFLLEMEKRISIGNFINLPMSRQDIADYLGVTIETVSRTFTSLQTKSTIVLPTRRSVVLRKRSTLQQHIG
jgi:CRP/FNR family nitrogen fixation transcriptional regulator